MLHFAVGVYNALFSVPEYRVLIVGPGQSGKSVLLEQLKYMYAPNNVSVGGPSSPNGSSTPGQAATDTAMATAASVGKQSSSSSSSAAAAVVANGRGANGASAATAGPSSPPAPPAGAPLPAPPSFLLAKRIRPTVGMNYAKIRHRYAPRAEQPVDGGERALVLWDVGGAAALRPLWASYYPQCQAVIYVVDGAALHAGADGGAGQGAAAAHHAEARLLLEELLTDPQLAGVPVLVLSNKCDLNPHIDLAELQEALGLAEMAVKAAFYGATGPPPAAPTAAAASEQMMAAAPASAPAVGSSGFGNVVVRLAEGSALDGRGLTQALDWLVSQLDSGARPVEVEGGQ